MQDSTSIITRRAPQYATLGTLPDYLIEAAGELDSAEIGDNFNLCVALLALHKITLDQQKNAANGQLTKATEGQLSLEWRGAKSNNDDWSSTKWGRELEATLSRSIATNGSGLAY